MVEVTKYQNGISLLSMLELERDKLIHNLIKENYIKSDKVKDAFQKVNREKFLPDFLKNRAYIDTPLEIGHGQTISAPHMVAIMCEALDIKKEQKILEIGEGSGYHAAIVAYLVGKKGHVYTVERIRELGNQARANLSKAGVINTTVEIGDGSEGLEKYQPYDRIYVTCAAHNVPSPLINQLKEYGKLLIPVGKLYCELKLLEKKDNQIISKNLGGCVFVPLVGRHGF